MQPREVNEKRLVRMIKGNSVYLRPIRQGDMASIFQASQNEEIVNMAGFQDAFSLQEITNRYKRFIKDPTRYDFAVCLIENDQIIGDLSLLNIDQESKKADFRIVIHNQNLLNRGYSTEATQLAQDFLFKELELNRIEIKMFSHNVRGIKTLEKTGFKTEGVLRQSLYFNYQYTDMVVMAMIRIDYHQSRLQDDTLSLHYSSK